MDLNNLVLIDARAPGRHNHNDTNTDAHTDIDLC